MFRLIYTLAFTFAFVAEGSTFYNIAKSPIMHGAAQYHQYNSSRFDASIERLSSEANLVQTDGEDATKLSNTEATSNIDILIFQRLFTAKGGMGLKLGFSQTETARQLDDGFFAKDQFNFKATSSQTSEAESTVKIAPILSYTMGDHVTLGVEVETLFGKTTYDDNSEKQFNAQTGIPSITFHLHGLEVGAVYRPTSRANYTDLSSDEEVKTQARKHSSYTGFMRFGVGMQMALGGYYKVENFSEHEGNDQSNPSSPQNEYGAHVEFFRDGATKFELIASKSTPAAEPDGVLSFQSAEKMSLTGSFVYRHNNSAAIAASATFEKMQQTIKISENAKALANGDSLGLMISSQWKM
jgi:hypothetical protein